jgi:hypothetical protein
MNLSRCPKEFNKFERRWWKFYLQVVTERGIMTAGKYSTLRDLCSVEAQIEYNLAIIRESNYAATYQETVYVDSTGLEHKKVALSPIAKRLEECMKLKSALKKSLGLFYVPAENEKQTKMEGMLDG